MTSWPAGKGTTNLPVDLGSGRDESSRRVHGPSPTNTVLFRAGAGAADMVAVREGRQTSCFGPWGAEDVLTVRTSSPKSRTPSRSSASMTNTVLSAADSRRGCAGSRGAAAAVPKRAGTPIPSVTRSSPWPHGREPDRTRAAARDRGLTAGRTSGNAHRHAGRGSTPSRSSSPKTTNGEGLITIAGAIPGTSATGLTSRLAADPRRRGRGAPAGGRTYIPFRPTAGGGGESETTRASGCALTGRGRHRADGRQISAAPGRVPRPRTVDGRTGRHA